MKKVVVRREKGIDGYEGFIQDKTGLIFVGKTYLRKNQDGSFNLFYYPFSHFKQEIPFCEEENYFLARRMMKEYIIKKVRREINHSESIECQKKFRDK